MFLQYEGSWAWRTFLPTKFFGHNGTKMKNVYNKYWFNVTGEGVHTNKLHLTNLLWHYMYIMT